MFKKFIKAVAATVLMASPLFGAGVNGLYRGQSANGPVMLQINPGPQGYLVGKLRSSNGLFAVVAQQNGSNLNGMFGAPGAGPMQFTGTVQDNGTLVLTCAGQTIQLQSNQPAPAVTPANPLSTDGTPSQIPTAQNTQGAAEDPIAAQMDALAKQAAAERQQELSQLPTARNYPQNYNNQAAPQGYPGAYGQMPAQTSAYGNYQAPASNYPTQPQTYQAPTYGNTPQYAPQYTPQYVPQSVPQYAPQYTPQYTPMPAQVPAMNLNQPADDSAIMSQYEHQQAVDDQMSLQRSDTTREQNRYVGPDGNEIVAPENATQVTVDQANQATYTTEQAPTPPADETVAQPYSYTAPETPAPAEGDGN